MEDKVVNIEILKDEIIKRLRSLDPDKIILFGSYAYGTPTEDSDIDLFLVKNTDDRKYKARALLCLRELTKKYKIGFDILSAPNKLLQSREDHFYRVDILKKGRVLYVK